MRTLLGLAVLAGLLAATPALSADDALQSVLDPYFRIQSALSDDTTEGVRADATAIATAAGALGQPGAPIARAAGTLAGAPDLAAARLAFGTLSDAVVAYADAAGSATGDGVHVMFCPMVDKQWLQKGEAVRNPYYGKSMLACGEKKAKK